MFASSREDRTSSQNEMSQITRSVPVQSRSSAGLRISSDVLWYIPMLIAAAITVIPFLWLLGTSFKSPNEPIITTPPSFIPQEFTVENYIKVWNYLPVWRYFINSVIVAAGTVVLDLLVTSMAAYPLAKMNFRGREVIFYLLLATLVVPSELTMIPSYVLAVNVFQYRNTYQSLILPAICSAFNIFLLRQAFKSVPNDLIHAGRIDGAGEFRIWWQIMLPSIRPALATVAIFTMVGSWNAFLWPRLMLSEKDLFTLPVGLTALAGVFFSDFRALTAGVVLTILPILIFFFIMQRHFVSGLAGAIKG